ncbi:MAG: S8 family serine peptidase, partial [Planctomycetota bacterium]
MVQRPKQRRVMRLESLQSRQLLAADLGGLASLDLDDGVLATASITGTSAFADPTVSASDAGSTRSTARDLGSVEDSVGLSGSLSYRDTLDVFRFELDRDGDVDLALSRMRRDADVFIADADGNILQRSSNPGRRNESLSRFLSEGTYYIGVQSRSFWGTGYRLELDVDLVTPEPPPPATPISPSVPGGQPVTPITPGSSNPSAPSGSIAPLNDVAYFGGSREWNLNLVAAPESWAAGYTGEGVTVAVIDTGVDLDHADLIDNLFINPGEIAGNGIDDDGNGYVDDVSGYDFASRDANPNDVGGHGTHVAGSIAAGNNGFGATGVAPDATILPVRVLGNNGSGRSSDVAAGIRYAVDLGADIINLSLGGGYSRAIDAAIDYAEALGVFVVAAAGNEAAAVPGYPDRFSASNENVLSVGAIDQNTRLASF